jgi:MFS transporter, DHA3 family, macrolide efflux protein
VDPPLETLSRPSQRCTSVSADLGRARTEADGASRYAHTRRNVKRMRRVGSECLLDVSRIGRAVARDGRKMLPMQDATPARPTPPNTGLAAPLVSPDFRLALGSRLLALTGNAAQSVVLALLVLDATGLPSGWGTILTVQAIPQVLLTLAGGLAVDRFSSLAVMAASNVLYAATLAPLIALALGGPEQIALWQLYAYAVASGVAAALFVPASQTIVPDLVPTEQVRSANALWTLAFHASRFVGPPAATLLVAQGGHAAALAAIASLFVASTVALAPIRRPPPRPRPRESPARQLREGLDAARRDAALWAIVLTAAVYNFGAAGGTLVGLPSLAKLGLDAGDEGVGILFSALGAGALLGIAVTGSLARVPRQGIVGSATNLGMGLALLLAAVAPSLWLAVPWLVVAGAFQSAGGVIFLTLVQLRAPAEVRGRIMALLSLSLFGLTPLAYGLGGLLGDLLGPRGILVAGGLVVALTGAILLASRPVREIG